MNLHLWPPSCLRTKCILYLHCTRMAVPHTESMPHLVNVWSQPESLFRKQYFSTHTISRYFCTLKFNSTTQLWARQTPPPKKTAHLNMQDVCSSPWARLDNAQYQQRAIAAWSTPAWLLSDVLRILPEHSTWRIMIMGTYCLYQRLFTVPHLWCQAQKRTKKKKMKQRGCPTSLHANMAGAE